MHISAIVPVKTFSKAKSRLRIPIPKKVALCKIMFKEIIETIYNSQIINNIIVVSKNDDMLNLNKIFNIVHIKDEDETGVNNAIKLADEYVSKMGYDASVIFPQDIPLIKTEDIRILLRLNYTKSVLVVPSKRFDGTNALVRMPVNLMTTHYDEDSYKIHLEIGKKHTKNTSLVLIKSIMFDIDNLSDLKLLIKQNEKPKICNEIHQLVYS